MSEPPPPPPTTIHGSLGTLQQAQVSGSVRDIVGEQRNYYLAPSRPIDPADLTAAQVLLAQMPVSDDAPIPLPGALAVSSFLNQLLPNPLVTGRDADLCAIARATFCACTGLLYYDYHSIERNTCHDE